MVAGCRLWEPTPSKSLRSLTLSAKAESLASKARFLDEPSDFVDETALPSRREGRIVGGYIFYRNLLRHFLWRKPHFVLRML